MDLKEAERAKYQKAWDLNDYRKTSPGENRLNDVLDRIPSYAKVIDFGAGTGRAALKIHQMNHPVVMVDFAENCLDESVKKKLNGNFRFIEACLWEPLFIKGDYGYCTDVLEHIPPEKVDTVLDNILNCVPQGYLNISTVDDYFGQVLGEPLHLTVRPWDWWADKVSKLAQIEMRINPSSVSIWFKEII